MQEAKSQIRESRGNVKLTVRERFDEKWTYEPNSGCHIWTASACSSGYGTFRIGGRKGKVFAAHRLSWEFHNGLIPEDRCVLHKCDTPACINPAHLFLGTKQDNSDDAKRKGRTDTARGESNGMAKLTDSDVRKIRASKGVPQWKLGERFGVVQSKISAVLRRETWAHIQ